MQKAVFSSNRSSRSHNLHWFVSQFSYFGLIFFKMTSGWLTWDWPGTDLRLIWERKMKIESSRQTWTKQTNERRLAFLELLTEPKISWHSHLRSPLLIFVIINYQLSQTKSMKPFKSFICSFIRTNMSKQFCNECWRRGRKKLLWCYCWNIFINFEWSSSGFKNPNSQIYFWLKIKTNFYL